MSKIPFIPQEWMSAPSKGPIPEIVSSSEFDEMPVKYLMDEVERVTREAESQSLDIAPDYKEWVSLGFALNSAFGEEGRGYFHRLSRFHPEYSQENTDKQYDNCMKSKGGGITVSTLFFYAKRAGISISTPKWQNGKMTKRQNGDSGDCQIAILPNCQKGENTDKWLKDEADLPTFPEKVYDNLPPFLKECVANAISPDDRATILLGSLACLSTCFDNVCGVYDQRVVYSNLYFFLVANAGMGKGALTLCRELVAPINKDLRKKSKEAWERYRAARAEYNAAKDKAGMDIPVEPPQYALIIPANSSAASFLTILADNNGIGLLFETEGDTLSTALKSDFGNFSDALRKASQHEPLSCSRRTDRLNIEVERPRVSVALAGTPEQVTRLIPDAENGLLSRFMFFVLPFKCSFRDVFSIQDVAQSKNAKFRQLGELFQRQIQDFTNCGEFVFTLGRLEQVRFLDVLREMNRECCLELGSEAQGVVRRLGLMGFRIMMLLTAIRKLGQYIPRNRGDTSPVRLECTTEDFETAMDILDTISFHSFFVFEKLKKPDGRRLPQERQNTAVRKRMDLFARLPDEFSKKEYSDTAQALGVKPSTMDKWISWFIDRGMMERVEQSSYRKLQQRLA